MSNQNIGGIAWTVDADTSPAIKSTAEFNSQVDKVEQTLQGLDTQVSKTARSVNRATTNMSANFGQAGIQVQQFVGQIQGGQSAMLALSQQAADIGIVLGAPMVGVVVALAASFAGMLLPSLFDSADAIEELEKATENLQAAFTLSAGGVEQYSKKMDELKQVSEGLFEVKLRILLAEQQMALVQAAEGVDKYIDSFRGLNFQQDLFGQNSEEAFRSFVELSEASRQFKADQSVENLQRLEAALDRASKAGMTNTKEGIQLFNQILDLVVAFRQGEKRAEKLTGSLKKGTTALDFAGKSAANYESILQRLEIRGETLRSSQLKLEKQLILAQAAEDGASESMRNSIAAAYDKLIANEQIAESERAKAKAITEANKQLRREKEKERELNKITDKAETVAGKYGDPLAELEAQKEQELEALRKAEEAGLQLHTEYAALRAEIDSAYQEKRMAAMVEMFENESELNATMLSSIDALGSASKNVFKSIIDGSFSARDAALTFANAILDEVINSIVSIGVEYAKNALVMSAIDKSQMASKQAMQAANAAQHTAAVSATVAELASLGAAAAMASTAAIPIVGPGIAPAAGAAMAGLITATGAPAIASAPIAGAREHGGSVMANSLYEVGEKNKPELLMIPGNNGKVFSNAEMRSFMNGGSGGGSAPIVNIHNYSGSPVETRTSGGLTEQQVIDIIIGQTSNGNTRAMRNITRLTSATNNAAANRR